MIKYIWGTNVLERSEIMWSPVCDIFADDESESTSAQKEEKGSEK